jgi:hypothetical protein
VAYSKRQKEALLEYRNAAGARADLARVRMESEKQSRECSEQEAVDGRSMLNQNRVQSAVSGSALGETECSVTGK